MSVQFQYRADFLETEEGTELGDEGAECAEPCYDISNDTGAHGILAIAALDSLREKIPQRTPGKTYRVMISGRIVFSQDYYGECDADAEVEWATAREFEEEPEHDPDDNVFLLVDDDTPF